MKVEGREAKRLKKGKGKGKGKKKTSSYVCFNVNGK